ncbi:hypothetical protein IZU27_02700 [Treponema socranskii]|uniref:hypothetical protein n=1 Tax=Treponema socranskii TaxID=53419 RepID=UPI003D91DC29
MSNTRIINESDKHYVVRSLEVLEGIKGAGISSIRDTIQTLQSAQQSLAQETQDYWSAAADDSMVSPEEKKMLYKEWQHLLDEYASLIQAAVKAQVPENSGTLAAYKNAYTQLYDYIIQRLKLFDDMTRATQLPDRRAFIDLYTTYYAMRDALRDTISLTQLAEGNADIIPPDRVTGLTVYAEEHIITLSWNALGDGLRNTLKQYAVTVKKAGSTEYVTAGAVTGNRFTYVFNRQLDGYPEKDELAKWSFKVTAVNIFNKSGMAAEKTVNTDGYGTWIPKEPIIVKRESNRQITLYLSEPEHVYGNFRYKIQIKKVTDAQWYKPATSGDYLASEDAYKAGDGWETVSQLFSQTLPLEGQNAAEPLPVDTTYLYRVSAYNETGKEAVRQIEAKAHATGVRDIVASAITTNKLAPGAVTADKIHAGTITSHELYTGDLAAGGASFGKISAGGKGLHADKNNFWDLENQEFRIGNDVALENNESDDAEYLHYKKDKGIFFKLKNFIVSSISSIILGIFRVKGKGDTDANSFLVVNPTNTKDDVTGTYGKRVKVDGTVQSKALSVKNIAIEGDTVKNYYYFNLRAYPTDTFYPIFFNTWWDPASLECDIQSEAGADAVPYNQNRLSFSWVQAGWSDAPKRLTIFNYGCYDRNEITIFGLAASTSLGSKAIYVRGGLQYYLNSNHVPELKTQEFLQTYDGIPSVSDNTVWRPIKQKTELGQNVSWYWLAEDGEESTYVNSVRTPAARITDTLFLGKMRFKSTKPDVPSEGDIWFEK